MKLTRRNLLRSAAVAAPALALLDAIWWEPKRVIVTRHTLQPAGESVSKPLRFIQLSDLHIRNLDSHLESVAEIVNGIGADLIVLTGDSIDAKSNLKLLDEFLGLIPAEVPKLAILGNWEHWADVDLSKLKEVYEKHSCKLLVNESAVIAHGGNEYLFTGLDDLTGGNPSIEEALKDVEPKQRHVLLQHSPAFFDSLAATALSGFVPRYMLSGHTHGGQVSLFGFAPVTPPGSGKYVAGWYEKGEMKLYVSRGIGTIILPVRFMCPPEISVFEWT